MVELERDGMTRCGAAVSRGGKEARNASWKKEEASHGTRSDGWDGTGSPDWTAADRPFGRISLPPPRAPLGHLTSLTPVTGSHPPTKRDESTPIF
jgi:hypothetical protein